MMPGDEIRQDAPMHAELFHRVQRPGGGVVHAADATFEVRIGIVTRYGFDSPLEFLCVLAEVMPQPSQISPIGISKDRSKLAGKIGNRAQMFFKVMDDKCAILVLTDMRQILFYWWRITGCGDMSCQR